MACVAVCLTVLPVAAQAAGGGGAAKDAGTRPDKETKRPRSEADLVGGRYMQVSALWVPVVQGRRARYQAVTPRLVPAPDQRVPACFNAPWAQEALLMALNATPLSVERLTALDVTSFKADLLAKVHAHVGQDGLYADVVLLSGVHEPDPAEFELSIMCR